MNKDAIRRKKLKDKERQRQYAWQRKAQHERDVQRELGTDVFGYWQMPLDGYTAEQMWERCKVYGDWNLQSPPKGERRWVISMFLYTARDGEGNRQLDLTDLELTCTFDQIFVPIRDHLIETVNENAHVTVDTWRSFARVRT